jgi:hypothetical protein
MNKILNVFFFILILFKIHSLNTLNIETNLWNDNYGSKNEERILGFGGKNTEKDLEEPIETVVKRPKNG